jgi:hypothetical protein
MTCRQRSGIAPTPHGIWPCHRSAVAKRLSECHVGADTATDSRHTMLPHFGVASRRSLGTTGRLSWCIAVELKDPKGFGRCRMAVIDDGSAASLRPFVTAHVEPGATLITDAWQGYSGISQLGYTHDPRSQRAARARGQDAALLLPGVHRVASLARCVNYVGHTAVGRRTGPSSVTPKEWPSSCSDSTAATHEAEDWSSTGCSNSLSATIRCATSTSSPGKGPGRLPPTPPGTTGHPPSLDRPASDRPWRAPHLRYSG